MARELTRRRRPISDDKYDPTPDESGDIGTEDEDEAPRGRGSRRGSSRSEEPSGRGRRGRVHTEEAAEDEAPRGRRGSRATEEERPKTKPGKGWGDFAKQKSESSDYAENMKVDKDEILFKFMDDGPFAVYKQHWIERNGKKSFNCLGEDDGCPLCNVLGDRPRLQAAFNVIEFPEEGGDPAVKIWTVGSRVAGQLETMAKNDKTRPLNRDDLYFSVSKSGKGSKTVYTIQAVKERDLIDDWDTEPLTSDELDALFEKGYDEDEIKYQTKRELREIADEALDD